MKTRYLIKIGLLCVLLQTFPSGALAQSSLSIVTPNDLTYTEGNIANDSPFSVAETMRYQQVYAASQFGDIAAGGGMLTEIAFRPDAVYGNAFTHTIANIQIDL